MNDNNPRISYQRGGYASVEWHSPKAERPFPVLEHRDGFGGWIPVKRYYDGEYFSWITTWSGDYRLNRYPDSTQWGHYGNGEPFCIRFPKQVPEWPDPDEM